MKCFAWENLKTEKIQIYEINLETWGQKLEFLFCNLVQNIAGQAQISHNATCEDEYIQLQTKLKPSWCWYQQTNKSFQKQNLLCDNLSKPKLLRPYGEPSYDVWRGWTWSDHCDLSGVVLN